jgi:hypothetical protein
MKATMMYVVDDVAKPMGTLEGTPEYLATRLQKAAGEMEATVMLVEGTCPQGRLVQQEVVTPKEKHRVLRYE